MHNLKYCTSEKRSKTQSITVEALKMTEILTFENALA